MAFRILFIQIIITTSDIIPWTKDLENIRNVDIFAAVETWRRQRGRTEHYILPTVHCTLIDRRSCKLSDIIWDEIVQARRNVES